ncbi:MAG: MspA family porin [Mycobacteriaceae bacterium]
MLYRITALLGVGLLAAAASAPQGWADPAVDPPVQPAANAAPAPPPPPAPGAPLAPIASASPGTLTSPDGWVLTVQARNESMEPVASLTNSPWSREYLVDSSFEGTVTGAGKTKLAGGTLEAGYQIGCGITQDVLESISGVTGIAGVGIPFATGSIFPFILGAQASQLFKINLKPGTVNVVQVGKKSFKGTKAHVNITGFRIKVDGCAGQSFIRSYATLTSSTDNTDDVVTYVGVTRAV